MKLETQEWVEKADGDLKVARREVQTTDPVYDAVCFHAQQCAESICRHG
jgi:HEPN domain-containing protein